MWLVIFNTCYAEIAAHELDQFKDNYELIPGESPQWFNQQYMPWNMMLMEEILADCTSGELAEMVKIPTLSHRKKGEGGQKRWDRFSFN